MFSLVINSNIFTSIMYNIPGFDSLGILVAVFNMNCLEEENIIMITNYLNN
jgi:hypothetical protein